MCEGGGGDGLERQGIGTWGHGLRNGWEWWLSLRQGCKMNIVASVEHDGLRRPNWMVEFTDTADGANEGETGATHVETTLQPV